MTGRAGKLQHFRYGVSKVRGRWYYRYHKPIGRANWKGYQERYLKPKDVEAKQRLVFAPKATTKQLKQSLSWQWRIPRMLAAATTPNQVLDAWVLFRYRHPKKLYHYMMTLKRLVQVGGCEPTDWRLKVLLHRMRSGYKRIIGIDVFAKYLSHLRLVEELEYLTRFMRSRINHLNSSQLETILNSFAACKLRDPRLVGQIVRRLKAIGVSDLSKHSKIKIIDSLGSMGIKNSVFVSELSSGLVRNGDLSTGEFATLLKALTSCCVRDHTVIELAIDKALFDIHNGSAQPSEVIEICYQLTKIGYGEERLVRKILGQFSPYDVPSRVLVKLLHSIPPRMLNRDTRIPQWIDAAIESICLIKMPSDIVRLASVIDSVQHRDIVSEEVWNKLAGHYMSLARCVQKFNVSKLAEIFHKRGAVTQEVWTRLSQDLDYSVEHFESEDIVRMSKVIDSLAETVTGPKSPLANVVVDWSIRRKDEFNASEWGMIRKMTRDCGANYRQILDSISV